MPVSIRSRLLLLVLSALLPGVAGALWLIGQTYLTERDGNERNLRDNSRALAMVVERELEQRATIARVLALSQALDAAPVVAPQQLALLAQQAQLALAGLQGWVQLSDGARVLLDTRHPGALAVAAAAPAGGMAPQPWLDAARVQPLHASPDGAWFAAAVEPVRRNGHTGLHLSATILASELQQVIDAQQLPTGRVGTLLDAAGTVVARQPGGGVQAGRAATAAFMRQLNGRREGRFESTAPDGAPTVGYFSVGRQGWVSVSAMPRHDFSASPPLAVLQVSAAALLLLGLAAVGALAVSRRIAGPVISLKHDATRLQAGQLLQRRSTGILECDEVAAALADAAGSVAQARADLERRVSEAVARTRTAEQRAAQSQRVEALGRLTGGVAHDFNNLLGVISNSAHLMERHTTQPELQAPLAATLRAVDLGSRLTQHLLRFAGLRPLRPQQLLLQRSLPEVAELLRSVLGKRIALTLQVAPGTQAVTADFGELELALVNLALNARDALPGGGQVRLEAANASAEEADGLPPVPHVRISFSDNGIGMAPELVGRAFEPFFSTKPAGTGTGMGLSQVHGFCVQAGGTARLDSTPGLGTTVSLLLPTTAAAAPDQAATADMAGTPGTGSVTDAVPLAGTRVLLVEDNLELADATAALLRFHGCTVERAVDAADALRLLQARPPQTPAPVDVVLSDIVMPGTMDGLALARALQMRQPPLPVVLMSGYSSALASAGGDFAVLHKPYPPQALLTALLTALQAAPRALSQSGPQTAPQTLPPARPPAEVD